MLNKIKNVKDKNDPEKAVTNLLCTILDLRKAEEQVNLKSTYSAVVKKNIPKNMQFKIQYSLFEKIKRNRQLKAKITLKKYKNVTKLFKCFMIQFFE